MAFFTRGAVAAAVCLFFLTACGGSASGPQQAQALQPRVKSSVGAAAYEDEVQSLYIAYFGRPADPTGLVNFENALMNAGAPQDIGGLAAAYDTNAAVKSLVDSFGASPESQQLYTSGNADTFVQAVFRNVLARAPAASGLQFWRNAILSGSISQGEAALSILAAAMSNQTAQGIVDAQLIRNRIDVAEYFTGQLQAQDVASIYSGPTAASSGRELLAGVTSGTVLSVYETNVVSFIQMMAQPSGGTLLAGQLDYALSVDGAGPAARFNSPTAMVLDAAGNAYIADNGNCTIRKVTPDGTTTTLAGSPGSCGYADGVGLNARFSLNVVGLAIDGSGNLYVGDAANYAIRKVTPGGTVTTVLQSPAESTDHTLDFHYISGLTVDRAGNIYVTDRDDYVVREISSAGVVTLIAGQPGVAGAADGTPASATFTLPSAIAVDADANLYVADSGAIRKITRSANAPITVTTITGVVNGVWITVDGEASSARFGVITGIGFDQSGDLLITDGAFSTLRKLSAAGMVSTVAGVSGQIGHNDGPVATATFDYPVAMGFDSQGNTYVLDQGIASVRKITAGVVSTLAGDHPQSIDGVGAAAQFNQLSGLAVDSMGNVFAIDSVDNVIRKIAPDGTTTTFAGTVGVTGSSDGIGALASFNVPSGIAVDGADNLYVTDSRNETIRKITPDAKVTTLAGTPKVDGSADGTGPAAGFYNPAGIASDQAGNLYVCDNGSMIRKITPAGQVTTLAGGTTAGSADGTGGAARFNMPQGVAVDSLGNVYVADTGNYTIREISPLGVVTTIAGQAGQAGTKDGAGQLATFHAPTSIVVDSTGLIYVDDSNLRQINFAHTVTTMTGAAIQQTPEIGPLNDMSWFSGLAIDRYGVFYVNMSRAVVAIHL